VAVVFGRYSGDDDVPDLDFSQPRTEVVRPPVDPFRDEKHGWYPGADEVAWF
jgi:hypothetical protein